MIVAFDVCKYGTKSADMEGMALVKKIARIITNSLRLAQR